MSAYSLGPEIGRGGFGKVYSAIPKYQDPRFEAEKVAIKVIDKYQLQSNELRDRVAAEVSIHSRISHPSIVKLYDYFEDNEKVYLIMELCQNGDLFSYLIERRKAEKNINENYNLDDQELAILPEPEIRYLMLQIGRAISYLHENSIIHRDLKLKNLVLSSDMEVKLSDFGLATTVKKNPSDPTTFCGTQNYISPEVVARRPYGPAIDLWAMGCLMYTLKTGKLPSNSESSQDSKNIILQISDSSIEIIDLIQKLLTKDPIKRISIKDYFNHPFFNPIKASKPLSTLSSIGKFPKNAYSSAPGNLFTPFSNFAAEQNIENHNFININMESNAPKAGLKNALANIFKNDPSFAISNKDLDSSIKKYNNVIKNDYNSINLNANSLINTQRLNPIKQKTKHAVIEILSDGRVKSEFFGDNYILVFDPSQNLILQFPRDSALLLTDKATSVIKIDFQTMNPELSRKVKYVLKFIELVRSKTCRVRLFIQIT
ncbi:Serine/threonine-protein kinase PLK4 [Smittium mucronatum]|uniref:Serine/threonine-protein kinase PLK4 n=1 Tax=Smittium mucronatum TaxID=133383 RepID=A0A1R0H102_9FUNG|nr:Serine/threonine-protein kinase PLK4 [Smittium mucronatum]